MSNKVFEIDSDVEEHVTEEQESPSAPKVEIEEKPVKKPRKKRILTEEAKEKLLKNLEAGRKKAMENRQKKSEEKRIIKKKKDEDELSHKNKLRQDLDEMKKMMQNLIEENSKLKKSTPLQPIKEEAEPQAKQPEPQAKQPEPVKPVVYRTKGIASRWAKYN